MTTSPIGERVRPPAGDGPVLSEAESRAVRRGVPDPGIPLPRAAVPTIALFFGSLAVWAAATWLALGGYAPFWVTIPLHAAVTFTMFTVLHEATHHAAGRLNWVNELFGRLSLPFVACYASFGMIRYIHIEHHRNTNEAYRTDPDAWTSHGPWWQLPLRWLTIDGWYAAFYAPRLGTRPRAEVRETTAMVLTTLVVFGGLIATGHGWELALVYLIPQRIGAAVLAWWFDWLPHHGLTDTARENRFGATRVRVGMEWLLTPVMLYQNYHLVHHLHPAIPFYRYVRAWRNNEAAYLTREVPITTAWGRELTASEYRAWRRLTASFHSEEGAGPGHTEFHPLTVAEVRPLTADSVSISFEIPGHLRDRYRFTPGQHLTLRTTVDGAELRRTYSLCTSATSDLVRIAVKRIEGGTLSTYLTERLAAGDVLEVLPPSGRFVLDPATAKGRHHVGIAAGSGITPVISMLSSALSADEESRFTLLYGNRTAESTMFRDELEMLARHFEGRLRIVHFRSADPGSAPGSAYERVMSGRIDAEQLSALFDESLSPRDVGGWFLCGPQELVDDARAVLVDHAVPRGEIHVELFHVARAHTGGNGVASTITATAGGRTSAVDSDGHESVLEAVLRGGLNAPYACMGGACGTCRAKLVSGDAEMEIDYALRQEELAAGYILTCQSRPTTERVELDFDA